MADGSVLTRMRFPPRERDCARLPLFFGEQVLSHGNVASELVTTGEVLAVWLPLLKVHYLIAIAVQRSFGRAAKPIAEYDVWSRQAARRFEPSIQDPVEMDLGANFRTARHGAWGTLVHIAAGHIPEIESIPEERRMLYAVQFFCGMRIGEAAARRFRDITPQSCGLDALAIRDQWDGQPLKAAQGDDMARRMVPIPPELDQLLAAMRRSSRP